MVGPNKILTVSYGTFSCTLEGFDDPFSTMKAIAEYFRDLASEDRFFGAEPPTPDVQMLHAIAQKSSDKPVDAEVAKNGLRLTQGSEAAAATSEPAAEPVADIQPDVAVDPVAEVQPEVTSTQELTEFSQEDDFEVDTVPQEEAATDLANGVDLMPAEPEETTPALIVTADDAEPVEDIPAVAAEWSFEDDTDVAEDQEPVEDLSGDVASASDFVFEITEDDEPSHEDNAEPEAADHAPSFADAIRRDLEPIEDEDSEILEAADEDVAALFQIEETAVEQSIEAPATDAEDVTLELDVSEPSPDQDEAPAATSIAAKLQRIRSVVAASVSGLSGQKGDTDDALSETDDLTDDTSFGLDAEEEEDERTVETTEAETADEPLVDAPVTFAEEELFEDEVPSEPETSFEEELAAIEEGQDLAPRRGMALELSDEDLIAAAAMARPRNAPRPKAFERTIEAEQDQPVYEEDTAEVVAEDEVASDELTSQEIPSEEAVADEEAALLSNLAAIEDDLAKADAEAEIEAAAEAEVAAQVAAEEAAEARRARAQESLGEDSVGDDDETVERLLSQTNSKLNDDHTQRRQSALAHLKAAVAATIADRVTPKDGEDTETGDEAVDDYRKDLASIVRPRAVEEAPEPAGDADDTPTNRSAEIEPLVLVPQALVEQDATVRPRRINRTEKSDALEEQSSGFADYADEMGAHELHELLEAAAAYLSTVEGKTHFSRPEVMHMVMRHDRDRTFSREAQLRSFGDLLRNGTIEKVDRGQFVISNDSRFVGHG
ncbi:MAG: hypothetical protein QNI90_00805 [Dinoroseobacter sp.]|nr:hypothetical protein [Dinoroseobacter sp.]